MSAPAISAGPLLQLYAQPDLILERGEGSWVEDSEGRRYLDFTAGIAVTALGHASPVVHQAIEAALARGLIHTSNLYRTRPAMELAELLVEGSFPGGAFFCNSGAEANEAAFKFARRWAGTTSGAAKHEFVAFHGSFHGRLFGTLAATDRPGYREPFLPVMPGVRFADVGDVEGVEALLASGSVAGVIIEVVQGEGGVRPVPADFLGSLRRMCDTYGSLLIFDEIQCGLGRTGELFAWQHSGVTPDLMTLAKPLAGGLPMGAVIASDRVAATLKPGDHATTFGGGPLVASVAVAVTRTLSEPSFLARVRELGTHLGARLEALADRSSKVREIRGLGLLQGVVLDGAAGPVVTAAREAGLLVVSAGPDVVRIIPPLTITEDELDAGVDILERVLATA